jgi:hypothetical protein
MLNLNFVIVSPLPEYVPHIGGITVAHTLANELSKLGENVYLYSNSTHPKYNIQCIPWGVDIEFDSRNTIVILIAGAGDHTYLHNVPSSLANCPNIVRWQVNHQVKEYPINNKFYKYHSYWDTFPTQKIDGLLSVIEVDQTLFQNRNLPRKGVCYLIKGNLDSEPERAIHSSEDLCIDLKLNSLPPYEKMEYLADIFNQKELFISYTHLSFTSVLAAMCGCPSLIIPKSGVDEDKFYNKIWCTKYGLALGEKNLSKAIETLPLVHSMIDEYLNKTQPTQIKQFIKDCYEWIQNNLEN